MARRVQDTRHQPFWWVANDVVDDGHIAAMGAPAWAVYSVIVRYGCNSREAFPSIQTLMKLTGLSKQGIINSTKKLVELGYIWKKQGGPKKGSNVYKLRDVRKPKASQPDRPQVVNEVDQGSQRRVPDVVNDVDPIKKNKIAERQNKDFASALEPCPLGAGSDAHAQEERNSDVDVASLSPDDRIVYQAAEHLAKFFNGRVEFLQKSETFAAVKKDEPIAELKMYALPSGEKLEMAWISPVFRWLLDRGYTPEISESATLDDGFEVKEPMFFDPVYKHWSILDLSWQKSSRKDLSDFVIENVHLKKLEIFIREQQRQKLAECAA
ncbi:helix-turn-helix domain-containing protein [Phormidium sp. FACHB-592]|uniref:Helix-turn-helix domain-containing protein n=1 Tax=Stenomitos frigidus AS-A4 TaxID=2933935 RepID=A0ABV0KES4_9CYAN|nr:helix-turn-helix domain-containing protein [Phormidium sp. FACHB-592]MBD2076305.1 helix-turn-helix domain-containing protein [Phormidium sp. FACHB-592]